LELAVTHLLVWVLDLDDVRRAMLSSLEGTIRAGGLAATDIPSNLIGRTRGMLSGRNNQFTEQILSVARGQFEMMAGGEGTDVRKVITKSRRFSR
jgi:hypothetical protein